MENIAKQLVEIDDIDCPANENILTMSVFLEFKGDPSRLTMSEIVALEGGFCSMYNGLITNYCDVVFRQVKDVTIAREQLRRLQIIPTTTTTSFNSSSNNNTTPWNGTTNGTAVMMTIYNSTRESFQFWYDILGRCRGCTVDSTLYDDGFRQSLVTAEESPHPFSAVRALQGDNKCVCPAINPELQAPLEEKMTVYVQTQVAKVETWS